MTKKIITSAQNSVIKEIKELQSKKSKRKKEGLFVIEGIRGVKEIPKNIKLKYLVTTEDINVEQIEGINANTWIEVSKDIYKTISDTQSPQGAMAVAEIPSVTLNTITNKKGQYLMLENLQDPGNLGTIIRTAHAFGFDALLITKGSVDVYSPKVVRSTMGALFGLPIVIDEEAETYVSHLKEMKITLYTTALKEDAINIHDVKFDKGRAIVIGNEGNGVSDYVISEADYAVMISMPGGAESLNASVAAGICMYESMLQK